MVIPEMQGNQYWLISKYHQSELSQLINSECVWTQSHSGLNYIVV